MEENQTNQNLNQQPVQPQPEQVQQSVQWQQEQQFVQEQQQVQEWQTQSVEQPSVSMQIQQLLVQQQQYQKQYNDLLDYVRNAQNLPIEQQNEIQKQLDKLNALFVQGKQQLQALWYTQVQVKKPTEVKKWAKINFSFKKLAIGCGVVLLLIFTGFWVTLTSLIKNPDALVWIWVKAGVAKTFLMLFSALLFWSIIILMLGVIVANIYRLITVKNQSKKKYLWWLVWWIVWATWVWVLMWLVFWWINKIVVEETVVNLPIVQPYLVGKVVNPWDEFNFRYDSNGEFGMAYPLIAPAEFAFTLRTDKLFEYQYKYLWQNITIQSIRLLCENGQNQVLELSDLSRLKKDSEIPFNWTCLYWEKGTYYYLLEIDYIDIYGKSNTEVVSNDDSWKPLDFDSEIIVSLTTSSSSSSNNRVNRILPTNWEFNLGKAPAKMSVDTTQVFIDFGENYYNVTADLDWDWEIDRENQVTFDYSYRIPQVYHAYFTFPDIGGFVYTFPVRVIPSDLPVCWIEVENFPWTSKYNISTEFVDPSDAVKISSYQYTIKDKSTNKVHEVFKDQSQEFNYTFPEKWNYEVVLDYVTVDWKQWQCDSDLIQLKKETFDVQYLLMTEDKSTSKFKEMCSSKGTEYSGCTDIFIDTPPQKFQLQIRSITPTSNTLKKAVYLDDKPLLNDDDTYSFDILDEWVYYLRIVTSDVGRWMDEETEEIKITVEKPEILWKLTVTSNETKQPVSEWFEPLTVILDASKTEVNVPWDEIVFFTWDFGDWEIKEHLQNGVVAHTYNYDYENENWIFQPKVTIRTLQQRSLEISWPILNVKKWLINVDIASISHPSRQAPVDKEVVFEASFDWLPEKMTRDFGDGSSPVTCKWRACSQVTHTFKDKWIFSVKLTLEFDIVQQVDGMIDFKVY